MFPRTVLSVITVDASTAWGEFSRHAIVQFAAPEREDEADVQTDVDIEKNEMVWIEPPYRVLIHNDDVTTFEFVIDMLQKIFRLTAAQAEEVAMITHIVGIALVCVRPQSEAEQLVNKAIFAARLEGFPLMLTCEPE